MLIFSLEYVHKWEIVVCIYLTYLGTLYRNTKFSAKTVWHCCDLEIWSTSLKMVWTGKAQWVVPSCKVWHLSYVWCLSKSQCLSFWQAQTLTNKNPVNYLPWIHTRVTQIILCIIFLVHVAAIRHLNYSGQESKTCNVQFIFLTHLWPWNKVKVIKATMTMYTPREREREGASYCWSNQNTYYFSSPWYQHELKMFYDCFFVLFLQFSFTNYKLSSHKISGQVYFLLLFDF